MRIRKQLIARPGQRVGVDSFGAQYNIDRGNQTLVLQREAEMHAEMDKRGLRWQQDKRNELFVRGVFAEWSLSQRGTCTCACTCRSMYE